ncbi:hypothetical protein [Paenibacillus flagellatus]|uniref:Uncharacterized protein n=1 Tax=Paenibacillus flagellatus TaxID=2211139 RepID=A0A2V5KTA5_9BACL|nr:hypothetical protein [Paenibacillus flagellatus]PYI54927.1 hypothetical protein DLM86_10280 [Paenibacillus flagellatus]
MKSWYRLMIASLVSVGIASALSLVPKLDGSLRPGGTDAPVFRADTAVTLTDRNLVDVLVRPVLHLDIAHVEWNDSILSVDLKAKPGGAPPESIYDDLYELARLGFSGTKNVGQLLVRVLETPEGAASGTQLLLAMDAKRTDLSGSAAGVDERKSSKEHFLSSHFSLTYTHKWLDRHR